MLDDMASHHSAIFVLPEWRSGPANDNTSPNFLYHFQVSFDRRTPSIFVIRLFTLNPRVPWGPGNPYAIGMQLNSQEGYTFATGNDNPVEAGWVIECDTRTAPGSCSRIG